MGSGEWAIPYSLLPTPFLVKSLAFKPGIPHSPLPIPYSLFKEIATGAKLLHMLKHPQVLPFASTLAWLRAYTGHSKAVVELSMRLPSSHQKVAQLIQGAVQLNGAIYL